MIDPIIIETNLSLKWGVQIKNKGRNPIDFFSSDEFQPAKDAYELACRNVTREDQEWVALFVNGKMAPDGWINPKIRYLKDYRINDNPISSSVSGLINSIPGGAI